MAHSTHFSQILNAASHYFCFFLIAPLSVQGFIESERIKNYSCLSCSAPLKPASKYFTRANFSESHIYLTSTCQNIRLLSLLVSHS